MSLTKIAIALWLLIEVIVALAAAFLSLDYYW